MRVKFVSEAVLIIFAGLLFSGCSLVIQGGRRSDVKKIEELTAQVDELSQAQQVLAEKLSQEIKDKQIKLKMMEKGLVITFLTDVLFDSGKSTIKTEAMPGIDKVAVVLNENVPDLKVGIEGHTDNEPIKHSQWRSNWELSTSRALSVLHYLIDDKGISPERLSAIGYGEYRPVVSNDTKEGCRFNRRVEVVIMPRVIKVKEVDQSEEIGSKENLK